MSALDPLDQLRKLAALKEDGIVDADEFNRMKAELLARVATPLTTTANIPGNDASLTIPPAPIAPPPTESRITQADVDHWKEQLTSRELAFQQLAKVREGRRRRLAQLRRQIRYFNFIAWTRGHFKNLALGGVGPIVVSTGVGAFLAVVVSSLFSGSMLIGGLVGSILSLFVAIHVFAIPETRVIDRTIIVKGEERKGLELLWNHDEPTYEETKARATNARRDYDSVLAQFHSRRNQLLNLDWRLYRGEIFEEFLKNIFDCLGYRVKRVGKCGDQGVDLVVEKDGVRLAVQAKGYANSVGNDAVQQAHAGLTFHRCHRCAVITNSTFTPSAIELARRVGCILIDGSQINALIFGKVEL